jgi:hypothetical protein
MVEVDAIRAEKKARKKEATKAAKKREADNNRNRGKRERRRARGLKKPGRKKRTSVSVEAAANDERSEVSMIHFSFQHVPIHITHLLLPSLFLHVFLTQRHLHHNRNLPLLWAGHPSLALQPNLPERMRI